MLAHDQVRDRAPDPLGAAQPAAQVAVRQRRGNGFANDLLAERAVGAADDAVPAMDWPAWAGAPPSAQEAAGWDAEEPGAGLLAQAGPPTNLGGPIVSKARDTTGKGRNPQTGQPNLCDLEEVEDHNSGDAGIIWRSVADAPLFKGGAAYTDVQQGVIGDCYFMAALAAVCRADPKLITSAVKPGGPGRYYVRFFKKDPEKGTFSPEWVEVSAELPARRGGDNTWLAYGGNGSRVDRSPEIWAPIFEKAFAQWKGDGYTGIGNGGWEFEAMEALTGRKAHARTVSDFGPAEVGQEVCLWRIRTALDQRIPVAAATPTHAMAVVGCTADSVILWDPHGKERPFRIGLFQSYFVRVSFNGVPQSAPLKG